MKTLKTVLLPLFALALLVSCKNEPKHPNELKAVDSLCVELVKADSLLCSLPKEKPSKVAGEILGDIQHATEAINIIQDTISLETATFLTEYRSVRKLLSTYADSYDRLKSQLDTLSLNCSNLSHDLKNNTLAQEFDAAKSVANEKAQAGKLIEEVRFLVPAVSGALQRHDTLSPKVKAYLAEMDQKVAAKKAEKTK